MEIYSRMIYLFKQKIISNLLEDEITEKILQSIAVRERKTVKDL